MKKKTRNNLATIFGFATSLVTAMALIDFDSLDWTSINSYVKLAVTLIPAAGGYVSEIKEKPTPQ